MNKLVKTVNKGNLYYEYLNALNGILQLTNRELELLTKFVELDVNFTPIPGVSKNVANTDNRRMIKSTMGITPDNLSRYISKFKKEGLLVQGKADRIEYVFRNKTYIATPELSKGCCVGCAFVNNMNCANFKDRMDICHKGYIFKRKFNHIDE